MQDGLKLEKLLRRVGQGLFNFRPRAMVARLIALMEEQGRKTVVPHLNLHHLLFGYAHRHRSSLGISLEIPYVWSLLPLNKLCISE